MKRKMLRERNKKTEVLAPAGTYLSMKAAINAGADAVYLGGKRFGARAFAGNFDDNELINALDYVHLHGKKLYLTVNTLLYNNEISELESYIGNLYKHGLDAVIVQDMGVLYTLH
jgi:putative protease